MGILFAILAAVFAALVVVLTKAGLEEVDSILAFAIQAVMILLITWTMVLVQGSLHQLAGQSKRTWLFLIAAGICTTLSTVFSYRALKLADATLVVPIERMSLVIVVILSVLFLKEKMSWQAITGIVLMVAGAILVSVAKK
jgi:transporter family protein